MKLLFILFAFLSHSCAAISGSSAIQQNMPDYQYGDTLLLKMKEEVRLNDSIAFHLDYFSHKHPYADGPTKATAYVTITRNGISEEISLSIHGHLGKSEKSYDTIQWQEFEVELIDFNYDKNISLVIRKWK